MDKKTSFLNDPKYLFTVLTAIIKKQPTDIDEKKQLEIRSFFINTVYHKQTSTPSTTQQDTGLSGLRSV